MSTDLTYARRVCYVDWSGAVTSRPAPAQPAFTEPAMPSDRSTTCSFDGCGRSHHARGVCSIHAKQQRNKIALTPIVSARLRSLSDHEILMASAHANGSCIEWTGGLDRHGYGRVSKSGVIIRAHRLAWVDRNGPIPPGLCVLHRCDNRKCINPEHLWLGTHADNAADRSEKGRGAAGSRNGRSVLTIENVAEILATRNTTSARLWARTLGVAPSTVDRIRMGGRWNAEIRNLQPPKE